MQNRSATEDATNDFKPNGNGQAKAFSIGPSKDAQERTLKILALRRRIQESDSLLNSEKNFAVWLLDRALHPDFKERDGVVVVSRIVCARVHRVTPRTIDRWNISLKTFSEIWIDKQFRPNMWPSNRYHFSEFDPKREDVQHTGDGLYGTNKLRHTVPSSSLGARKNVAGQKFLPLPGSRTKYPQSKPQGGYLQTEGGLWVTESLQVVDVSSETRNPCRVSPDTHVGSDPTPMSGETRHPCRVRPDTHVERDPTPMSGETRHESPASPDANRAHKRVSSQSKELENFKGEGNPPGFDEWLKSIKGELRSGLRLERGDLLQKLRTARSDTARAEWQRRVDAVDVLLHGPKVNDAPAPKPKPKTVAQIERLPTAEELADGAAYAASIGKKNLVVTAEQLAALQKTENHQRKAV